MINICITTRGVGVREAYKLYGQAKASAMKLLHALIQKISHEMRNILLQSQYNYKRINHTYSAGSSYVTRKLI